MWDFSECVIVIVIVIEESFLTLWECQSWKVNSKTEICSKTADPHLTVHWFKEVETAKSIDEHMTSRSIVERCVFPDYDHACACSTIRPILTREIAQILS